MRLLVMTVGAATVLAATLAAGAPGGTSAQFTICGLLGSGVAMGGRVADKDGPFESRPAAAAIGLINGPIGGLAPEPR